MRIVGYARLSRASEESTSIARQREVIEKTCEAKGWTLVDIFEDVDISALKARLDRPGLSAARDAIADGRADAVLVWRLDRLCRSVGDFVTLLDEGLNIVSATEPIDTTTPMGRAMAQVLQVFAELEARTTSLRTKAAREFMIRAGRWPGGSIPYGYKSVDGEDGKMLVPDPAEQAVVNRIMDDVQGGKTLYAVAMALNEEGVPTKFGKKWQTIQLRRILTNDASAGYLTHNGALVRDERGLPVQAWEPVVPPERLAVFRAMFPTGTGRARRRKASRVLSGLIKCAGCGANMNVNAKRNKPARYVCPSGSRGLRCEVYASIHAEYVEAEVERQYLAVFGFLKVTEVVQAEVGDNGLSVVEGAIRDLGARMSDPSADVVALAEQIIELRAERDRIAALPSEVESVVVETDQTIAELWADAEWERRRDLLISAGTRVEVAKATNRGRFDPSRAAVTFRE